MKILYLIPARGGSKGIYKKNIKKLAGKPLIYYSIDIAKKMSEDKYICVSSDDEQIISKVEEYGLKVPFKRPDNLATDTASTYEVILHALNFYEKLGEHFDCLVLLQPTSPFRKVCHVEEIMNIYNPTLDMVVSVKETSSNPYNVLFEENVQGFLEKSKKGKYIRRQDCPKVWEYNGSIFVMNTKSLKKQAPDKFLKIKKYIMEPVFSIDIDNELDWKFAEFLILNNKITV